VEICEGAELSQFRRIAQRYEIEFLEIGADKNHVHFLIQSVPTYLAQTAGLTAGSATQIITTVKSITVRELFSRMPSLKKSLWGSAFANETRFILVKRLLCGHGCFRGENNAWDATKKRRECAAILPNKGYWTISPLQRSVDFVR